MVHRCLNGWTPQYLAVHLYIPQAPTAAAAVLYIVQPIGRLLVSTPSSMYNYVDYYSFTDPVRMEGWVGLVSWPIADTLPAKWSYVNHRSGVDQGKSVSKRPTSWPLSHAATMLLKSCMKKYGVYRSDADCGYNQLVYSSLAGLKQHDRSLLNDSLQAARWVRLTHYVRMYTCGLI